jgi:glucose-6-phosphate 1-dehydrogenase
MLCRRWPEFERRISDLQGGYDDSATYRQLADWLQHTTQPGARTLYYSAIPPLLYPAVVEQLQNAGLNRADPPDRWTRVVIEKPFGHDLASARQLNAQVHAAFDEAQVYRIKHYLAKETVKNLLVFRFAYALFESLSRQHYVNHARRAMAESVGVGHRAGYYGGVPFYERSGKALAAKTTEITLVFRQAPHLLFGFDSPPCDPLSLYIRPNEGVHLRFHTKVPGVGLRTQPVDMAFRYGQLLGARQLRCLRTLAVGCHAGRCLAVRP